MKETNLRIGWDHNSNCDNVSILVRVIQMFNDGNGEHMDQQSVYKYPNDTSCHIMYSSMHEHYTHIISTSKYKFNSIININNGMIIFGSIYSRRERLMLIDSEINNDKSDGSIPTHIPSDAVSHFICLHSERRTTTFDVCIIPSSTHEHRTISTTQYYINSIIDTDNDVLIHNIRHRVDEPIRFSVGNIMRQLHHTDNVGVNGSTPSTSANYNETRYGSLPEYGEQITLSIDRKYTSVRITVGNDILHLYNMYNLLLRHNVWAILHIAEWHTTSISSYSTITLMHKPELAYDANNATADMHTEEYTDNIAGTNNNNHNSIHMQAEQDDTDISDIVHVDTRYCDLYIVNNNSINNTTVTTDTFRDGEHNMISTHHTIQDDTLISHGQPDPNTLSILFVIIDYIDIDYNMRRLITCIDGEHHTPKHNTGFDLALVNVTTIHTVSSLESDNLYNESTTTNRTYYN